MKALAIIAAGIALVVAVSVAVVVLAGGREAEAYPADTPEGAFQRYLTSFEAGDLEAAYGFLSSRVKDSVTLEEYERQARDMGLSDGTGGPARRVLFDRATGEGERVTLHLIVEELYGEGLSASRNRYPIDVPMLREDGTWRIDTPLVGVNPGYFPALPKG